MMRLRDLAKKFLGPIRARLLRFSHGKYWQGRASRYGYRAVFDLGHDPTELEAVTKKQKDFLYPLFLEGLRSQKPVILDFGCGPGRFTGDLAELTKGYAIGVDPIETLLDMAPKAPNTEYRVCKEGQIPLPDSSVDAAWICLVLGGIRGRTLKRTVREVDRVLKPDGFLFLVENTTKKPSGAHWFFRSIEGYAGMFSKCNLVHLGDYYDFADRISVLAGRKIG